MVNGVLVERTVKDIVPALKTNSEGLKKVLDELLKQYKRQQDEMEKWKVRYFLGVSAMHMSICSKRSQDQTALSFGYSMLTNRHI